MKIKNTIFSEAGAFRCCIQNFYDKANQDPESELAEGAEITCPHCKATAVLESFSTIEGCEGLWTVNLD